MVDKDKPSALWVMQMAHLTKMMKDPSGKRLVVMDNFYTGHLLARQVAKTSDDEIRILGTVRLSNIDGCNRKYLKEAIDTLGEKPRFSWLLVQAFDRQSLRDREGILAKNCGFVVFKDRKIIIFYSNDLADTPSMPIEAPSEHSITCIHGIASLNRWV